MKYFLHPQAIEELEQAILIYKNNIREIIAFMHLRKQPTLGNRENNNHGITKIIRQLV